jgi:hypothetical protein
MSLDGPGTASGIKSMAIVSVRPFSIHEYDAVNRPLTIVPLTSSALTGDDADAPSR